MNRHNSEQYTKIKKSHFLNSVFVQPGVYSCAIDCFLEVSTYLFLPVLSKLSARSQFPELLFAAASDYQNQGGNPSLLAGIREPVWSYLRERCSSFQARDGNASFSQIFEEKTFGKLNPDEVSLFATQRLFESYCPTCNKNVNLNSNIFLTYVSQSGLEKFRYDKISWPLYVSSIHTEPGKLRCGNCRSLTDEPLQTSVVNSKFLFIEFAPEALAGLIMYDKIEVGNCWYNLKSLVRFYQSHFTCGIVSDQKWLYFDDLLQTVREFPSLEAMQRHIPGGWFFAVFELNGHSSSTNRIEMPVIKNLGGKPIATPSSTHFQTRSQRKDKLKKGVAPPQQELETSVAGNNTMKNRTHYVLYQSQDPKNTKNTPIIKNVETVESPGSNSATLT